MKQISQFIPFLVFLAVFHTSVWAETVIPVRSAEIEESLQQNARNSSGTDAVNALLVPNDSAKVNQLRRIDVAMENNSEISAFQFDWLLPDGFTVVADSCSLTDRSNGHGLSISYITSNTVRFISYSGSLKTYSGNSGALVQVALKAEQEVSPDVYPMQVNNVVLSDVTGNNVVTTVQNGQFRVLPNAVYDTVYVAICEGENYTLGTETLTDAGEYTQTFTSLGGADSVVTLYLSVNPVYQHAVEAEICQGEKYVFGTQTLSIPGNYTETFESFSGCDSTVTLTLTIHPAYNHTIEAFICQGDYYLFSTKMLHETGEYTKTFQTVHGCDSTVTLKLTVLPKFTQTAEAAICEGQTYRFGTQTLTTAGEYTETFETAYGCDSVVTLNLSINQTYHQTVQAAICEGESYSFGSQNITEAGEYTEAFETVQGCDSVVTLILSVNPGYNQTIEASICEGEFFMFGTQNLNTIGEYTETFQTEFGCDSTVTLYLSVLPSYTHFAEASICEGETYWFGTQMLKISGEYTEVFETAYRCDSTVFLTLWVYPSLEMTVTDTIFNGESVPFGDQLLTEPGEYTHTFHSGNGCDSVVHLTLIKNINTNAVLYGDACFKLGQNYPNPFSGHTTIPFELGTDADEVIIKILDLAGREIQHWQIKNLKQGAHKVEWNSEINPGVYIYKLDFLQKGIRSYTESRIMVII